MVILKTFPKFKRDSFRCYRESLEIINELQLISVEESEDGILRAKEYYIDFFRKGEGQNYAKGIQIFIIYPMAESDLNPIISSKNNNYTEDKVFEFFIQTLSALDNLQIKYQMTHKNLKPSNILLLRGRYVVADMKHYKKCYRPKGVENFTVQRDPQTRTL